MNLIAATSEDERAVGAARSRPPRDLYRQRCDQHPGNILGNLVLIPLWGINGAAAATALSVVFVSVAFAILAYRMLGIQPTALLLGR